MGTFGWKSPLSVRFGGRAHESVENAYTALRANLGDAFSVDEDSAIDVETQAQARLLADADAALERFVAQFDPRALTTMLPRWESILGLVASVSDSMQERRQRVAARLLSNHTGSTDGIDRIARESFSPWKARAHYVTVDDAVMYWPGGTTLSGYPWYSTIAHIVVEYLRPAWASEDQVRVRRAACISALDEYAPAWATFSMTETPAFGATSSKIGFFLDRPNLDKCVLR